ncbi:MAG: TIGR00730 family Rossman fold protein [Candidatus Riflebacteria bacterium]|nr:TIGR00730 family Rossman fold protein [Candidatus Riflebacteria bacterium]
MPLMMKHVEIEPRAVAVYCASASGLAPAIIEAGRAVGMGIANAGCAMVYGGTTCGLMGITADACKQSGGRVVGVIPRFMVEKGIQARDNDESVLVADMRSRKAEMQERAGAFIILPGGLGTFDELFEIIAMKQLRIHNKPIVLVNVEGFYEMLLAMLRHGVQNKTIRAEYLGLIEVAATGREAVRLATMKRDSIIQ